MKLISQALKKVFNNKSYVLLASGFAVVFLVINLLIPNIRMVWSDPTTAGMLIWATAQSIAGMSLIFLIGEALLAGMVMAMSAFVIKRQVRMGWRAGSTGFLASVVTPTCPSCAIGLLPVLGLGGVMTALPFGGWELAFLSVAILSGTLVYLSRKVITDTCKIKEKKRGGKK